MGRKCFVPNYNSGYKTSNEKVTLFNAPSDPERLVQWALAIPRKDRRPMSKDTACAKHFPEDMVLRTKYYAKPGGEVVPDVPKRTVLLQNAVPSIFPSCPSYLSTISKKRKSTMKRKSPALSAQKKNCESHLDVRHWAQAMEIVVANKVEIQAMQPRKNRGNTASKLDC